MNEWRPIETAPRGGKAVLVLIPCYGKYQMIGQLRGYQLAVAGLVQDHTGDAFWMSTRRLHPVLWTDLPDQPAITGDEPWFGEEDSPKERWKAHQRLTIEFSATGLKLLSMTTPQRDGAE